MTLTAQSIIRRVVETLQDPTSIRWTVDELVRYLNDGQRAILVPRPDAITVTGPIPLAPGPRQALPAGGTKLLEVVRNSAGTKRAVRITNREILDAQLPNWPSMAGTLEVLHYMYDPRDPRAFMVYPPAAAGASVEGTYSAMPVDITEPSPGALYTAVTGSLGVPDIYANALQDYVLARCFMKDSEYAGNAQRAQAHYQLFATALSVELKGTMSFGPTAKSALAGGAASSAMAS